MPALNRAGIDAARCWRQSDQWRANLAKGQRVGLIAGSGVGKSTLLGMMTRHTVADVVVLALIGERGREAGEFLAESLGPEGLRKAVVVLATSDCASVMRRQAAEVAHLVAEYFRDQGKDVLLLCDSLTRIAHAQREIGLATGEPPTNKGYPPSVFSDLPKLIERGGPGDGQGTITSVYTVLSEHEEGMDPIVEVARASLDGQIMLSRELADTGVYPAINLRGSISRLASRCSARMKSRWRLTSGGYGRCMSQTGISSWSAPMNKGLILSWIVRLPFGR